MPPLQCFPYQQYGHVSRSYASSIPRCSFCSVSHDWRNCPSPKQLSCANCKGSHAAVKAGCLSQMKAIIGRVTFIAGSPPKAPRHPVTNSAYQDDTQRREPAEVAHSIFRTQKRKCSLPSGPALVVPATFKPGAGRPFLRILQKNGAAPPHPISNK